VKAACGRKLTQLIGSLSGKVQKGLRGYKQFKNKGITLKFLLFIELRDVSLVRFKDILPLDKLPPRYTLL